VWLHRTVYFATPPNANNNFCSITRPNTDRIRISGAWVLAAIYCTNLSSLRSSMPTTNPGNGVWWAHVPMPTQYTTKLLDIWPPTARQFRTMFSAIVCVQPAVIKSPSHATGSARTAVGLFLLLVRRSGTHCPKTCGIRSVLWTVTEIHWRRFYFRRTSVFSALEVCYKNALYKFTSDIGIDIWA